MNSINSLIFSLRTLICNSVLVFSILVVFSCEKEIDYPAFGQLQVESISNSSFLTSASVKSIGEFGMIDHGFIYQVSDYTVDPHSVYGTIISLGSTISSDTFSAIIKPDLSQIRYYSNPHIYFKAYIKDGRGTVYSEFFSLPVSIMKVNSVVPAIAAKGDTITIYGNNFNEDPADNAVTFNNQIGTTISATANMLCVIVPPDIPIDYYWNPAVSIKVQSGTQVYQIDNFYLAPSPESFSPKSGTWNTTISIYGSNLQSSSVFFNESEANVISRTTDQIDCYVSSYNLAKRSKIYLKYGDFLTEVPGGYFEMDKLVVNIQNYNYYAGEALYLTGEGFNPNYYNNNIFIGDYSETAYSSDLNNVCFYLPSDISTGSYTTKVSNLIDTVTLSQKVNIVKPLVSNISILTGLAGTQVQITGTHLRTVGVQPSISFGYYSFMPVSVTSTKIVFNVPDIPPGEYYISLYYSYFVLPMSQTFTVL